MGESKTTPQNAIKTLTITELLGKNFLVRQYQRGYRWTQHNVLQLLNDIWDYRQKSSNRNTFYCLQPIVVRAARWQDENGQHVDGYELIDGQQRLTTIHRIITYLMRAQLNTNDLRSEGYSDNLFGIYYQTRPESKAFLESDDYNDEVPDLYYMSEAYRHIKTWFENPKDHIPRQVREDMYKVLLPGGVNDRSAKRPEWSVQVIWYEIKDSTQTSEALFTRLNRGKIPLTSAELIKAKFVNADSFSGMDYDEKVRRTTLLIQIWDEIENQLNNSRFWAFVSNEKAEKYHNRIEYIFDIEAGRKANEKDPLFTFLHFFDSNEDADSLWRKWIRVEEIYRLLMLWYSDKHYYHRIGYLIVTGTPIKRLIDLKKETPKREFESAVVRLISETIPSNWYELRYDNKSDQDKILRVLLLVNIELTRESQNYIEFFPFEIYKSAPQSLEHIHAQNIESVDVNRKEEWLQWLDAHIEILSSVAKDKKEAEEVIKAVTAARGKLKYENFKTLSERILALIPSESKSDSEYLDTIENMALLDLTKNISLGNSVFEVKRRKVVKMDRDGYYIPPATKRVFLKYYSGEATQHYCMWTADDRKRYLADMTACLRPFMQNVEEYAE